MADMLQACVWAVALGGVLAGGAAEAGSRAKAIWRFTNSGYSPVAGLVADSTGNLYGLTSGGGNGTCSGGVGCGEIYELSPPVGGVGRWKHRVLYQFQGGADGGQPGVPLVQDANGVLYGYTNYNSPGTVFSLTPGQGGKWNFQTLYTFTGRKDGYLGATSAALVVSGGDLYGVAPFGGVMGCFGNGCGTFFRLEPGGQGAPWTETTLIEFKGGDGPGVPDSVVGPDASGALYVATAWTTARNDGVVLQYTPSQTQVITRFSGAHGGTGPSNLVLGTDGDVYGLAGGRRDSLVFQLAPSDGGWARTTIAALLSHGYPVTSLSNGPGGTLVGSVYGDADFYYGNMFSLTAPGNGGGKWIYHQVWSFTRGPAYNPISVTVGAGPQQANLFAVLSGGDTNFGAVAEFKTTQ